MDGTLRPSDRHGKEVRGVEDRGAHRLEFRAGAVAMTYERRS